MGWIPSVNLLAGPSITHPREFRVALKMGHIALYFLDEHGDVLPFPLHRRTLEEAYAWLTNTIRKHTGIDRKLVLPDHELPSHPVATGAAFELDAGSFPFIDS